MRTLTKDQSNLLKRLRQRGLHAIAEAAEICWRGGQRYYIDDRVRAQGIRRAFQRGNREAVQQSRQKKNRRQ